MQTAGFFAGLSADISLDNWCRRDVLKCGAALGAGSITLTTTTTLQAAPGDEEWAFETGPLGAGRL